MGLEDDWNKNPQKQSLPVLRTHKVCLDGTNLTKAYENIKKPAAPNALKNQYNEEINVLFEFKKFADKELSDCFDFSVVMDDPEKCFEAARIKVVQGAMFKPNGCSINADIL